MRKKQKSGGFTQQVKLIGGGDYHKIWDKHLDLSSKQPSDLIKKLSSDPSVYELGLTESSDHGTVVDLDKIKQVLVDCDPTKKKIYFDWILTMYRAEWTSTGGCNHLLIDIVKNMKQVLEKVERYNKAGHGRINVYDFGGLFGCRGKQGLLAYIKTLPEKDLISKKTIREQIKRQGGELVYEDDDILVVRLLTQEASFYYGAHTKWCTASKFDPMFDSYKEDTPLYVIIPKKPIRFGEKYQFHAGRGSFYHEKNNPIDHSDFVRHRKSLVKFFELIKDQFVLYIVRSGLSNQDLLFLFDICSEINCNFSKLRDINTTLFSRFSDSYEVTKFLLSRGLRPTGQYGMSSLCYVTDPRIMELFLQSGENPDVRCHSGRSLLEMATNVQMFMVLVKYGCNTKKIRLTMLSLSKEIIKRLLETEVPLDVNLQDNDGRTLLFETDDINLIEGLKRRGIDPTIVDTVGRTPLFYTTDPAIIELLIEMGVDPEQTDVTGHTFMDK
jgi:hypothetical protein